MDLCSTIIINKVDYFSEFVKFYLKTLSASSQN